MKVFRLYYNTEFSAQMRVKDLEERMSYVVLDAGFIMDDSWSVIIWKDVRLLHSNQFEQIVCQQQKFSGAEG